MNNVTNGNKKNILTEKKWYGINIAKEIHAAPQRQQHEEEAPSMSTF